MKYRFLFLSFLLIVSTVLGQKRFLVSPSNDVIPLGKGESARRVVERMTTAERLKQKSSVATRTPSRFGYPPDVNPIEGTFLAFHKDVLGMWFVSPAKGTIDTIFWQSGFDVGALDSAIIIRVLRSEINTQVGPGIPPYPPPSCMNWGYWVSTNDGDQGLAPFADYATDPTWHSTVPGAYPSFPPFGEELWGFTLGIRVIDHPNQVNSVAMNLVGVPLNVNCGDAFFITMRVNGSPCCHTTDGPTTWTYSTVNAPSPSRLWKFYEHESPAECQGTFHHGWTARSLINNDTTVALVLNWWYVMTLEGDPGDLVCPADVTVNASPGQCRASVNYTTPTSSCGTVSCSPPSGSSFDVGTSQVTCKSISPLGDTTTCSFNVTVLDNQPPSISVSVNPTQLWPPNHQMVQVNATVTTSDNCPGVSYVLTSVTSNEPDNGLGDGDLTNDIQGAATGTADNSFFLRAERSGSGTGRIYTITYTATDASGHTSNAVATVRVPITLRSVAGSEGNHGEAATPVSGYRLADAYPNPFNPTTELRFELAEQGHVWLRVYDMLGKEVATLVNEQLQPGVYVRTFDASGLPSGIYVSRLDIQTAGKTYYETRKLVLMR